MISLRHYQFLRQGDSSFRDFQANGKDNGLNQEVLQSLEVEQRSPTKGEVKSVQNQRPDGRGDKESIVRNTKAWTQEIGCKDKRDGVGRYLVSKMIYLAYHRANPLADFSSAQVTGTEHVR